VALVGTIGISIGQPFLLNAFTKLAAVWFPNKHRATVTGVLFLAMFLGIGLGEALTPLLLTKYRFGGMQMIYGVATAASCLLFLIFARSKPPTPPEPAEEETRALVLEGFKSMLRQREVYLLSLALLLGSGIVNAVFTLIDGLGREHGITAAQGVTLTIVLLVAGIIGSIALPAISDEIRQRKLIILLGILGAVPATLCLALGHGYGFELTCFFVLGFCITGVTPVAYQYGAEITHPAPEGASNGIFALVVQASGLLIVLMDALKSVFHDSYVPSLVGLAIMLGASGLLFLSAKESPDMLRSRNAKPGRKTVFLTGASSGIGASLKKNLLQHGYEVWGTSRNVDRLEILPNFHPVSMSLEDAESIRNAWSMAVAESGGIDVVIQNAGEGHFGSIEEMPKEHSDQIWSILVTGPLLIFQLAATHFRPRGSGTIVGISSLAAEMPPPFFGHYSAAKAAISSLLSGLWMELKPFGVRVLDVRPGDIRTEFDFKAPWFVPDGSPYAIWTEEGKKENQKSMKQAPPPSLVSKAVLNALSSNGETLIIRTGDFFQAGLAPIVSMIIPRTWMLHLIRLTYGQDRADKKSEG
jgi:short-subunit dehydrogenase/predicted MFS family arabinose efflux permease